MSKLDTEAKARKEILLAAGTAHLGPSYSPEGLRMTSALDLEAGVVEGNEETAESLVLGA